MSIPLPLEYNPRIAELVEQTFGMAAPPETEGEGAH